MSSKNSASVLSPTPRWFSNSCAILDNKDMRTSALVSSALCPAMTRLGRIGAAAERIIFLSRPMAEWRRTGMMMRTGKKERAKGEKGKKGED